MTMIDGNMEDGTWEGDIPGQGPGTIVYWKLIAEDVNGNTNETDNYNSYFIFGPSSDKLVYINQNLGFFWIWPIGSIFEYYFYYGSTENFDFWMAMYGSIPGELLPHYNVMIELTGGEGPQYINDDEVAEWWSGDKTYIVAGDEWLGRRSAWTDGETAEGSVARNILGIAYEYNDINYVYSEDKYGVSRLNPDSTGAASILYEFLSDSLLLNYDPYYETGNDNWLDGFEVVDGYIVDMTAYSGVLDSNGNVADDAEIYNVMVHGQAGNGGKSAFLSFDPIALNTTPSYHWVGASSYWNMFYAPNCPPNASPLVSVYEALAEKMIAKYPNSVALRFRYLTCLGKWAEVYGIFTAAKEGVADLMKEHSEIIIDLDSDYENGGGYFMLGAVHFKSPYIPFILSWPDNDDAIIWLRKAYNTGRALPVQKTYLARALFKDGQKEEALRLVKDVIATPPEQDEVLEESLEIEEAKKLLNEFQ